MFKMGGKKTTIGSPSVGDKFAQRGSSKPMADWPSYPRVTKAPQQYGYGVTPQNMVSPPKEGQYRAGRRLPEMNVSCPNPRGRK